MAKIVVDTNEFIDILKLDKTDIEKYMQTIKDNLDNFIFPRQIIDETIRHILIKQKEFIGNMENNYQPYDTKLCKKLKNSNYTRQINNINKELSKLKDKEIENYNIKTNVVIDVLANIDNKNIIPTTPEILKNAGNRKICGNPPSSNSRIGDEIIWESILSWAKDDVVLVTSDHTFFDNEKFLDIEYKAKGHNIIGVFKDLNVAIEKIGKNSQEVKQIEKKEQKITEKLANQLEALYKISDTISKPLSQLTALQSSINSYNTSALKLNELYKTPQLPTIDIPEFHYFDKINSASQLLNSISATSLNTNALLESIDSLKNIDILTNGKKTD